MPIAPWGVLPTQSSAQPYSKRRKSPRRVLRIEHDLARVSDAVSLFEEVMGLLARGEYMDPDGEAF